MQNNGDVFYTTEQICQQEYIVIAQHVSYDSHVVHLSLKSVCHAALHQVKLEAKEEIVMDQLRSERATSPDTDTRDSIRVSFSVSGVLVRRWLVTLGRAFALQLGQLAGHEVPFKGGCIIIGPSQRGISGEAVALATSIFSHCVLHCCLMPFLLTPPIRSTLT